MSDTDPTSSSPLSKLIERLIPGIRYPWLLVILGGLFALDMVVPDPIPVIDEVMLAVLTVLAASWRSRRKDVRPPPKDVTPPEEPEAARDVEIADERTESDPRR